ncbi:hypothetical protein RR48_11842 [Papilio machaon]|uniref:Uncharacterized protein n=1 Tax=Papilio machaon TaxID=76193 RepID=A0A194QP94_PAPMA|nr:hypothetical protein RR48_11842 [Papilio machaon]
MENLAGRSILMGIKPFDGTVSYSKKKVTQQAKTGRMANPRGGIQYAISPPSITNGANMEPTLAIIDENPIAAFLTTVGNSSEQYKYTTTKTIKLDTTPVHANTTENTPEGTNISVIKQRAQIKLNTITIVFLPAIFNNGIDTKLPRRETLALAATLINTFPLKCPTYCDTP